MNGIILTNAYYDDSAVAHQTARLTEELARLGIGVQTLRNDFIPAYLGTEGARHRLGNADFVVFLDKDRHLSYLLERAGFRLFDTARSIELCDDKMMTQIALAGAGLRFPRTVSAPLCYRKERTAETFLTAVEALIPYPIVVKECYGSLGKGVGLARNRAELAAASERLIRTPHLYQEFVESSAGRDLRVICVGGQAVAAMKRVSETDFRSNLELGGRAEPTELLPAFRNAAETAARTLGLDYCGVDLLYGADGEPIVCEVNSNAFFRGIESVTGANVAGAYASHIEAALRKEGRS